MAVNTQDFIRWGFQKNFRQKIVPLRPRIYHVESHVIFPLSLTHTHTLTLSLTRSIGGLIVALLPSKQQIQVLIKANTFSTGLILNK